MSGITSGSGSSSIYYDNDLDETEVEIKAAAGTIFWIQAFNLSASVAYLQLFDSLAASVIVGTTTPTLQIPIPTRGDTNGAGFIFEISTGIEFGTGITIAGTTNNEGSGAPALNALHVNIGFK